MINNRAFTFIEIIVSMTIITLISVSGTFYFHDFIGKQELVVYMDDFSTVYKELNNEVKTLKILDYSLEIDKNSYGYIVSRNNIGINYLQSATFDTFNNSGSINIIPASNNIWEIKYYEGQKKKEQLVKKGGDTLSFKINNLSHIESSLSGINLNSISFHFINTIDSIKKDVLIVDIVDNNGISQNSLTIKNIHGKLTYYNHGVQLNSPIYIIFEKNGIKDKLIIN